MGDAAPVCSTAPVPLSGVEGHGSNGVATMFELHSLMSQRKPQLAPFPSWGRAGERGAWLYF
jgi:hypothetical protein